MAVPAHAAFPGANGKIAGSDITEIDEFTSTANVFTINPDGSGFTQVTSEYPQTEAYPAWSPDGLKLAYNTDRDGNTDIYVMNPDGTGQTNLTNGSAGDFIPAWSPDGAKIAFVTNRDGNAEIYVMNADGSGQMRLTNNGSIDTDPTWSPDGAKIAFDSNRNGSWDVLSMNVDGTGVTNLTNAPGDQFSPSWSPDGSKIAYVGPVGFQTAQIFVMNRDGSGQTVINSDNQAKSWPAWSPDGTKIAMWRGGPSLNPPNGIAVMNADGKGGATQLPHAFGSEDTSGYRLDWQPIPLNYPRPKGASPFQTYLVPAYNPCTAPNKTHGSPLAFPSCSPPTQSSANLTLGTPDSNGQPANGLASVFLATRTGDVKVEVAIRDVRKTDLSDYTGQLDVQTALRITDRNNTPSPGGPGAATVTDSPLHVPISCTATGSATLGSDCNLTTTVNTVYPGAIAAGQRAVWELGPVRAYDGGADGLASTTGDNTLFLDQGIFIP